MKWVAPARGLIGGTNGLICSVLRQKTFFPPISRIKTSTSALLTNQKALMQRSDFATDDQTTLLSLLELGHDLCRNGYGPI